MNMVKLGNLIERPSGATNTLGPALERLVPMRSKRNKVPSTCQWCSAQFLARIDTLGRYCSPSCSNQAQAMRRRSLTPTPSVELNDPNARIIPLTKGKVAIVDDEDFESLSPHLWYAVKSRNTWYAKRDVYMNGRCRTLPIHRAILDIPVGFEVDHINGDGLDNRKVNLRVATHAQNMANSRHTMSKNHSGYRGVYNKRGRWYAQITIRGHCFYLGIYQNPIDAAHAYDVAAFEHFGDFAILNFPDEIGDEDAE